MTSHLFDKKSNTCRCFYVTIHLSCQFLTLVLIFCLRVMFMHFFCAIYYHTSVVGCAVNGYVLSLRLRFFIGTDNYLFYIAVCNGRNKFKRNKNVVKIKIKVCYIYSNTNNPLKSFTSPSSQLPP